MSNPQIIDNGEFVYSEGTAFSNPGNVGEDDIVFSLNEYSRIFLGNFLQFTNHDKLYVVKSISSVSGNDVTCKISPPLISTVSNAEVVTLGVSITADMKYDIDNVFGITYSDGVLTDAGRVKLVEDL